MVFKANLKGLNEPQWKKLNVSQVFTYFCLMKRMLDVLCPNSTWGERFLLALDGFPRVQNNAVNTEQMGIISDIQGWKLWKIDSENR